MPKAKKKPHVPWPHRAVVKMRAEGDSVARLILETGIGSGQRPGNRIGFTRGDHDGQMLKLRRIKRMCRLPFLAPLRSGRRWMRPRRALRLAPMPNRHILTNSYGGPMIYRTMADHMIKERKRLGMMEFDQHALR
ncbi:hypothetical protein [Fertoeibacter niger]|nr:hypothetical protein [Fertoeibacter niger]